MHSAMAARVPTRTKSGDTRRASVGQICSVSHCASGMSSATPLRRFSERCVCALTMPGMITLCGQGRCSGERRRRVQGAGRGPPTPPSLPHGGAERLDRRGLVARLSCGLGQHVDDAAAVDDDRVVVEDEPLVPRRDGHDPARMDNEVDLRGAARRGWGHLRRAGGCGRRDSGGVSGGRRRLNQLREGGPPAPHDAGEDGRHARLDRPDCSSSSSSQTWRE